MCLYILSTIFAFSQEPIKKKKDSTKITALDEVTVIGNTISDPLQDRINNNTELKIVKPKNVADLFNDINGFSTIKRGNYANDPTFRASQYEQLNI
ncbi:MAG: hypothetical protein ACWA45_05175 [Flavobacteriales bacterium]